jgi:hypothetical protein
MKSKAKQGKTKGKGKAGQTFLLNRCRHFCRLCDNRCHLWDNAVFFAVFAEFLAKINPREGDQRDKVNCDCAGKAHTTAVVTVLSTVTISIALVVNTIHKCFPCLDG